MPPFFTRQTTPTNHQPIQNPPTPQNALDPAVYDPIEEVPTPAAPKPLSTDDNTQPTAPDTAHAPATSIAPQPACPPAPAAPPPVLPVPCMRALLDRVPAPANLPPATGHVSSRPAMDACCRAAELASVCDVLCTLRDVVPGATGPIRPFAAQVCGWLVVNSSRSTRCRQTRLPCAFAQHNEYQSTHRMCLLPTKHRYQAACRSPPRGHSLPGCRFWLTHSCTRRVRGACGGPGPLLPWVIGTTTSPAPRRWQLPLQHAVGLLLIAKQAAGNRCAPRRRCGCTSRPWGSKLWRRCD